MWISSVLLSWLTGCRSWWPSTAGTESQMSERSTAAECQTRCLRGGQEPSGGTCGLAVCGAQGQTDLGAGIGRKISSGLTKKTSFDPDTWLLKKTNKCSSGCCVLTSEFGMGFELNHQSSVFSDVDPDDLQSGWEDAVSLDTCRHEAPTKEVRGHIKIKAEVQQLPDILLRSSGLCCV